MTLTYLLREHELLLYGLACRWRNVTWLQIAEMASLNVPPVGYRTKDGGFTRKDFGKAVGKIVREYAKKQGLPFPKRTYD